MEEERERTVEECERDFAPVFFIAGGDPNWKPADRVPVMFRRRFESRVAPQRRWP